MTTEHPKVIADIRCRWTATSPVRVVSLILPKPAFSFHRRWRRSPRGFHGGTDSGVR